MRLFRILLLVLVGAGLTVQAAAYAAAPAGMQVDAAADCSEMEMAEMPMSDVDESGVPCRDMSFACLVAMNCLPPLMLAPMQDATTTFAVASRDFTPMLVDQPGEKAIGPAPPPPKMVS